MQYLILLISGDCSIDGFARSNRTIHIGSNKETQRLLTEMSTNNVNSNAFGSQTQNNKNAGFAGPSGITHLRDKLRQWRSQGIVHMRRKSYHCLAFIVATTYFQDNCFVSHVFGGQCPIQTHEALLATPSLLLSTCLQFTKLGKHRSEIT